jgi:hypothetical protein
MLCSECSAPVHPVVALDIDGTLGRWHEHFFRFAEEWLGREVFKYWEPATTQRKTLYYDGSVPMHDFLGIDKAEYRACKLAFRQSGLKRSMPTWGSPSWLTDTLTKEGIEVWMTTTRPYLRVDNIDPDTRIWLARHRVTYQGLIYDDDKYNRLAEIVGKERIIGVVDDEGECYDRAEELGLRPILMHRETNLAVRRNVIVNNDQLLLRLLTARALRWRSTNDERG